MALSTWHKNHPEAGRVATANYTRKTRLAAIAILGNSCVRCGFSDSRALQIDHINGGGKKELTKLGGASHNRKVIKSVMNNEYKYQLLCANCNWIKRCEKGENPGRPRLKNY